MSKFSTHGLAFAFVISLSLACSSKDGASGDIPTDPVDPGEEEQQQPPPEVVIPATLDTLEAKICAKLIECEKKTNSSSGAGFSSFEACTQPMKAYTLMAVDVAKVETCVANYQCAADTTVMSCYPDDQQTLSCSKTNTASIVITTTAGSKEIACSEMCAVLLPSEPSKCGNCAVSGDEASGYTASCFAP